MIAGSVRMMQMVVDHYLALGTPYAVAAGMSLGGIITLTYGRFSADPGCHSPFYPHRILPNCCGISADKTKRNVTIPLENRSRVWISHVITITLILCAFIR